MKYRIYYKKNGKIARKIVDVCSDHLMEIYELKKRINIKSIFAYELIRSSEVTEMKAKVAYEHCVPVFVIYMDEVTESNLFPYHVLNTDWGSHAPLSELFYRTFDKNREHYFYINEEF